MLKFYLDAADTIRHDSGFVHVGAECLNLALFTYLQYMSEIINHEI
jgi:hypothetical protein